MIVVRVDLESCEGYANCVESAPATFDVDEATGKVTLLQERPTEDQYASVKEAVRRCPTQSIAVVEEQER